MNYAIFKYGIITLSVVAIIYSIISTKVHLKNALDKTKEFDEKKFKKDYYMSTIYSYIQGLIIGRIFNVNNWYSRCRYGRVPIQL